MTVDANQVAAEEASVSIGFPVTVGWTHAAIAVNSALRLDTPVNITMLIEMHGPLLIDLRHHAFSWSTPLELFPVDAVHTGLSTEPAAPDDPPFVEPPGIHLDRLLWEIGLNAFGGARAYWLPPDVEFRLVRWPNLTQHKHTMAQMQMIAVLGNTYVNVSGLAALAGVEEAEAQRVINALSLMRILTWRTPEPEEAAEVAEVAEAPKAVIKRQGLFARLRKRLGR